jgi:hypothetical protein
MTNQYEAGMKVKYIGGKLATKETFKVGDIGIINKDLIIEWENGVKSLPMKKINSLIEVIA